VGKPAWWKAAVVSLGILSSTVSTVPQTSFAADTIKVGKCLLQSCQKELAQCLLNPKCFANVVCLNTCNGRKDEAACQIKCGDLFENEIVGVFNSCAVSQKKCVPQKQDEGEWPMPAPESMVKSFDTSIWNGRNGRWYISAGLNKIFDTFDCQVHFFDSPYKGKFYAKLFWRVTEPDGEFLTKDAVQRFIQDPKNPAHLINHDNEYLHYKDDWYVIDYEPDDFVLVYYKGSNDAWDGYGGSFLYTRDPKVRPELVPRLEKAVASMGLKYKWSDFTLTDNSCKSLDDSPTVLREKYAARLLLTEEEQIAGALTSFRGAALNTLVADEKEAEKSIVRLEKGFENFLKEVSEDAKKELEVIENAIEEEVESIEGGIERGLKLRK
jgi:violaxanthin de-epoxidase